MKLVNYFVLFTILGSTYCNVRPGPSVIATKGEVWPKPKYQEKYKEYMILRPQIFKFQAIKKSCKILEEAFTRYLKIIINSTNLGHRNRRTSTESAPKVKQWKSDQYFVGNLDVLQVELQEPCEDNQIPNEHMHENYILEINKPVEGKKILKSKSIWGILRGLETFSQLLYLADDDIALKVHTTLIVDSPRYSHRGLLLDTSRHFIPMFIILKIIDGMEYNKLNVFHWHIVDDQSFPYKSKLFPELSAKGAYNPDILVYDEQDVQKVIRHAARRGIRVMSEFDTPGHTRSWGEGRPELLTPCYNDGEPDGNLGPIDPTKESTYTFLKQFFKEVRDVFPENYIHLGGDEVSYDCWQSNPHIKNWMKSAKMEDNYNKLEEYYIQKLIKIVDDLNSSSVVWEEVYVNNVSLPKNTIVHVWKSDGVIKNSTKDGYRTIWSSCWYLDHLANGGDWEKYYRCDPNVLYPEYKKFIIGGEACMWSEVVDATNVLQRIFPRVSAVAEKLWSPEYVNNMYDARRRLEEHTCRMIIRGIPAQPPNGPGFCL